MMAMACVGVGGWLGGCVWVRVGEGMAERACLLVTPSQKQPFRFLGQLAIIGASHARQLFSSVPVGVRLCCLWQCLADSTQWAMGLHGHSCVSVFSAIKEVTKIFVETADVKHSTFDMLV